MIVAVPAFTNVTVAAVLSLLKATVALFVSLDVTVLVPLQLPQLISNEPVVVGYVIVPLAGVTVIEQFALVTVNAYVAEHAL